MNAERLLAHYARIADAPDAIARLRQFVLDLAVRGKLLGREPGDEPPPDLLRLVSVAADKPGVPRGWRAAPVGTLLDFQYGKGLKASERLEQGPIPVYGSNGIVGYTNQPLTTRPAIIVGRKGSAGALNLSEGASWTTDVAYFVEAPAYFDLRFLKLALESLGLDKLGKGVKPGLSRSDAYQQIVLVPPLAEQYRIVAKVDELMALCDQLEAARAQREATRDRLAEASLARLNAPDPDSFPVDARFALDTFPALTTRPDQIKQLRQTILNLAVRGKLVPQNSDEEPASAQLKRLECAKAEIGRKERSHARPQSDEGSINNAELPSGWTLAPLSDLVAVLNGRAYKQKELLSAGTPVLRVGNLFTSDKWYYSDLALDEDKYCNRGDLIFSWSASFGPFIWSGERVIYHYHIWKLALHSDSDVSKLYLYNFLLQNTREIKDSGHGISMIHMTKEKMEKLQVPLPPLAEQHRIVVRVNELMTLCDQLEASLATGEVTRRRLLDALLHEALEPAAKPRRAHPRAAVSGYVVSRLASRRNFGRTAHMKHLYLAESRLGLNLGGRYMREAAGPLDTGIYELEKQAEAAGWYSHSVQTLASGKEKVSYKPGKALKATAEEGITVLGSSRAEMDRLIDLMGDLKTEQVEIIATLFAAWNDALLDGHSPDDDWIIKEVREHWHVSKLRFTPDALRTWLGWMRQHDVVPLGHPPRTVQQTTMEL